ncbi:MAG: UDP-N-acetylmuramoyl-tripeptide--D-alanyl-D-alanine ligase, partial [Clostridia bacterium]|nr:UDP-N-acetylmuramoyl-tripeptide--D-alanyl-D-alanine ligase [Clostridia bacterium]
MQRLTLTQIAQATDGILIGDDVLVESVSIDSRDVKNSALFVALKGENTDGHSYVKNAFDTGAAAVLVSQKVEAPEGRGAVLVDDTLLALGKLSKYYKEQFKIKTVAVTGSVGKTTTKDMLFSVMSQ